MATKTQRKRRLARRHAHQAVTSGKPVQVSQGLPFQNAAMNSILGITKAVGPVTVAFKRMGDATVQALAAQEELVRTSEESPAPVPYTRDTLEGLTCDVLRSNIAATLGVRGRSKMTKPKLIDAILEVQGYGTQG